MGYKWLGDNPKPFFDLAMNDRSSFAPQYAQNSRLHWHHVLSKWILWWLWNNSCNIKSYKDSGLSSVALHLFHTAILCGSFKGNTNVTGPLRPLASHAALFGHTSCQVTREQSRGLLWECTEISEISIDTLYARERMGGGEAGWGCYVMWECRSGQ